MGLSDSGLFLVANILSNILFGAYVSVAVDCTQILIRKFRETSSVHKVPLACFVLNTLFTTTKVLIDNVLTVRAFVFPTPDGQTLYPPFDAPSILALNVLWVIHTFVADSFIVYRVWVIWWRNYLITALPLLLTLACLGIGMHYIWILAYQGDLDLVEYVARRYFILKIFIAMTLVLNVICTGLIAYRILRVRMEMRSLNMSTVSNVTKTGQRKDPLNNFVAIIIESALVYTAFLVVDLAFLTAGSPLVYVITPVISHVMALVFGTIVVRTTKGLTIENTVSDVNQSDIYRTQPQFANNISRTSDIQVMLHQTVTRTLEGEDYKQQSG